MSEPPIQVGLHAAYPPLDALLQAPITVCIPPERNLVILHHASTVEAALQTLSQARVLSAPVMRPHTDVDSSVQWVALVSCHDLCRFIATQADYQAAMKTPISKVLATSSSSPLQVEGRTRIINVIEFLGSTGRMHRCLVNRQKNGLQPSPVSQSDINRCIASHLYDSEPLIHFANVQLQALGFGGKRPVSINDDATLADAIHTLTQMQVSCLAIIDKSQKTLIGNFSPSDLRGLGAELPDLLPKKVVDVLRKYSPASLEPISVSPTESIGVLMTRMATTKLHHIFCQDPNGKPQGLITLTDICNILYKFNPDDNKQ